MISGVGLMLGIGALGGLGSLAESRSNSKDQVLPKAFASSLGSWEIGPNLLCIPIHTMVLRNGKILYISGSADIYTLKDGPYKAGLLDLSSNSQKEYDMPEDIFCGGHCQLQNGNIIIAGGTSGYPEDNVDAKFRGLNSAYEFDVDTESFVKVTSMAHGRWYPPLVTLGDGTAMAAGGLDEFGCTNGLTEIYNPKTKDWTIKFNPDSKLKYCVGECSKDKDAGSPCYGGSGNGTNPKVSLYARMHLLPSGKVAVCGENKKLRMWDPATGHWYSAGNMIFGNRSVGTSVLLPLHNTAGEEASILAAGGSNASYEGTNRCEILTARGTSLIAREITPMTFARRYHNCVILPTGKIVIVGGSSYANQLRSQVYVPEMFDPETETWTILPAQSTSRRHHSEAILLPDGRIFSVGEPKEDSTDLRMELFSPWYMFETRPSINGRPTGGEYGGFITIPTSDASDITSVSFVRISTSTHGTNSDQRLIWLQITDRTSSSVTVKAPLDHNIAPPGYYLIHILNSAGVPSKGKFMRIVNT